MKTTSCQTFLKYLRKSWRQGVLRRFFPGLATGQPICFRVLRKSAAIFFQIIIETRGVLLTQGSNFVHDGVGYHCIGSGSSSGGRIIGSSRFSVLVLCALALAPNLAHAPNTAVRFFRWSPDILTLTTSISSFMVESIASWLAIPDFLSGLILIVNIREVLQAPRYWKKPLAFSQTQRCVILLRKIQGNRFHAEDDVYDTIGPFSGRSCVFRPRDAT